MPLVSPAVASDAPRAPEPIDPQFARASTSCAIGGHAGGCRQFARFLRSDGNGTNPRGTNWRKENKRNNWHESDFGLRRTGARRHRRDCFRGCKRLHQRRHRRRRRWTRRRPSWRVGSGRRLHCRSPRGHEAREGIAIVARATLRGVLLRPAPRADRPAVPAVCVFAIPAGNADGRDRTAASADGCRA